MRLERASQIYNLVKALRRPGRSKGLSLEALGMKCVNKEEIKCVLLFVIFKALEIKCVLLFVIFKALEMKCVLLFVIFSACNKTNKKQSCFSAEYKNRIFGNRLYSFLSVFDP